MGGVARGGMEMRVELLTVDVRNAFIIQYNGRRSGSVFFRYGFAESVQMLTDKQFPPLFNSKIRTWNLECISATVDLLRTRSHAHFLCLSI
jgi:hypothetical protein